MQEPTPLLWDAIAVNLETSKVRLFGESKTLENAQAISAMAIMRRGLDEEFYAEVHTGTYKEGDKYIAGKNRTIPAGTRELRRRGPRELK